ncbi:unnamed protein product [Nesidiocoris tenuis]|uniref:Uncharacterized protein n=1 Tax=Nesidiocoris tenuis TaxID=355587 RepID=A0A6H5FYB1_9HEMI|nr:unnamed protein product [Nesidiocoris tenuis]
MPRMTMAVETQQSKCEVFISESLSSFYPQTRRRRPSVTYFSFQYYRSGETLFPALDVIFCVVSHLKTVASDFQRANNALGRAHSLVIGLRRANVAFGRKPQIRLLGPAVRLAHNKEALLGSIPASSRGYLDQSIRLLGGRVTPPAVSCYAWQ